MARRGPKPQFSIDEVLDAAISLVVEHGVDGLTMSRLARGLGTSASALYRYYESKAELLTAMQQRAVDHFATELSRVVDASRADLDELSPDAQALYPVIVSFAWYLEHATAHPAAHRLIDASLSAPATLLTEDQARAVNDQLSVILDACAASLANAATARALGPGDAMVRTHLLWAAVHGLDHFRKRDRIQPSQLRVERLILDMLSAVLVGFGASNDAVGEALDAWTRRATSGA